MEEKSEREGEKEKKSKHGMTLMKKQKKDKYHSI